MRKRLVDSYTDPATSVTYGLRGDPLDFALAQQYTHEHLNGVQRDFLMAGSATALVSGFDRTLAGGLSVSVAAGQAFDAAGLSYETITDPPGGPAVVTLDAADPALPRIDLVYALLEAAVPALPLPRTFRRNRTTAELEAGAPPYLPENITRFSEEHTKATVQVRKGTPAASPVAPAAQANEVPLYQVRVNAGAQTLVAGNVTDVRNKVRSLTGAWAQIDAINANPILTGFDEKVQDALTNFFPDASPFDWTLDDANNKVALDIALATGALKGLMSPGDFTKLANATAAATANTLALRDANGDASFRRVTSGIATGTAPLTVASQTEVANLNANFIQGQNLASLDARYVDVAGDAMTGALTVAVGNSPEATVGSPSLTVQHTQSGNVNGTLRAAHVAARGVVATGDVIHGLYAKGEMLGGGGINQFTVIGGYFEAKTTGTSNNPTKYGIYATHTGTQTGGDLKAARFDGDVHVNGALSKTSGTFLMDHPIDALAREKLLQHGFVEAPEYLLLYRGRVKLAGGRARVDVDQVYGMTPGTLAALAQRIDVLDVSNRTGFARVRATEVEGGAFEIVCEDETSTDEVSWLVAGERADAHIKMLPHTNDLGQMIPEYDKPEAEAELLASLLTPQVRYVEVEAEADLAPDEESDEPAPDLSTKRGYLLNPEARGEEPVRRRVITKTETKEQADVRREKKGGAEAGGGSGRRPRKK